MGYDVMSTENTAHQSPTAGVVAAAAAAAATSVDTVLVVVAWEFGICESGRWWVARVGLQLQLQLTGEPTGRQLARRGGRREEGGGRRT